MLLKLLGNEIPWCTRICVHSGEATERFVCSGLGTRDNVCGLLAVVGIQGFDHTTTEILEHAVCWTYAL